MVTTQQKVLRVFGPTAAEISAVLRQAKADGCPGLRLLERDGEFAVCVQVSAPNRAMAEQYCDKWVQRLCARFGDSVCSMGETGLAQATLNALLARRKLIVAADETTGRLLGAPLQGLAHSEAVFDFGTESYADPQTERKINAPSPIAKKYPGDAVQAAAARAQNALAAAGADFAVCYMPATVGQCPFVLVCDKRGAAACALPADTPDAAVGNCILDLVRRRLLGLRLTDSSITFRPGRDRPPLLVSEHGSTTARFSLRRRTPAARQADFEPMLDFETAAPARRTRAAAAAAAQGAVSAQGASAQAAAPAQDDDPTGVISFETEGDAPVQMPARRVKTAARPAEADPMDIRTVGPQTARRARRLRTAQADGGTPSPEPSLLDGDIPDLSAGLDPDALAAAQAADAARPAPKNADEIDTAEFRRAAGRLFTPDEDGDAPAPAHSARKTHGTAAARSRSMEIIEKSERRRARMLTALLVVFLLLLAAGGAALWFFLRTDLGAKPAAKNYGTALYDETAQSYLAKAMTRRQGVVGYLGFPGLDGMLVSAAGTEAADGETVTRFATPNALDADTPGNTILENTGTAFAALAELDTAKENSGFTLYLDGAVYRCKTLAVYYLDPEETGDGAFDLDASCDLSEYYDYLSFVAGIQARSLYDTGNDAGDDSRFLTLTGQCDEDGVLLCVTGRLIEEDESAQLTASAVSDAEEPLLTAAQYQRRGQPMPSVTELLSESVSRYAQQSAARLAQKNDAQASDEDSDLTADIDALTSQTAALLAGADKLLAGLTDIAGSTTAVEADLEQGAEGSVPEQTVTVEQLAAATPQPTEEPEETAAPTEEPEEESESAETEAEETPEPTEEPEETEAPEATGADGETIDVTMNGTAQTMDLVECLAMIAQNELGSNAPIEAYKAQCVAAHCWIISQSGYPSVAGTSPGADALAAAQEVAHVLITYNGQVCFTPYFASASTGTASAADVWGSDRAWLQAVDSPYDQDLASNWNTNGSSSGSARFSRETLLERIKDVMDVDLTDVDPNEWFTILSTNEYGWVAQIRVGPEETCSGRWFRENLLARQSVDGRSLRSQCFTVEYDEDLDCFIFDVYGYGHGCGMSQWGAIGYARNGWSYEDILTHYYVGTTLTTY